MYAVPGCWAGLLGADCDYSPNPLNGTLQHKIVFVITFLIVESSVKQPLKKKKYLMCGCPCWKGFFSICPALTSVTSLQHVLFFLIFTNPISSTCLIQMPVGLL